MRIVFDFVLRNLRCGIFIAIVKSSSTHPHIPKYSSLLSCLLFRQLYDQMNLGGARKTEITAKQRWNWAYNKIIMQLNVSTQTPSIFTHYLIKGK